VGFAGLGIWQLERRAWKLDLIARVNARVHAEPQSLPSRDVWPKINAKDDEYLRVRLQGELLQDKETLVQAVTERGPGWWVMTPMRVAAGVVLINRGFVPFDRRDVSSRSAGSPEGEVTVTGLLRMTEPRGGFLRSNDPATGRWYSRDVAAISRARELTGAAPFFVDADATPNPGGFPIGGLTVVAMRNSHLAYALTWFALAGLALLGAIRTIRFGRSQ
jgi:surfeit locus 1 family protein